MTLPVSSTPVRPSDPVSDAVVVFPRSMTPKRNISIRDVAKAARVSTATVSRVLNKPDLVARDTAERVQRAISDLSYHPNIFAQGLMTRKSRLIGVALPDLLGEF